MSNQINKLPPLPEEDSVVHIYPWDLEKMQTSETFCTVFSVAVGCPDGRSVPLYTAAQMREYAAADPMHPALVNALTAASHALKSYQHGNASPDLATTVAELIDLTLDMAKK